jgi:cyclophilin family peptidyl-prolyl cis-trans isomerase
MKQVCIRVLCVLLSCLLAAALTACGGAGGDGQTTEIITFDAYATDKPTPNADMNAIRAEIDSMRVDEFSETLRKTQYVKISVKDYGDVILRLRPDIAPETVENFSALVAEGFYDGLTVHRVVKGFVIQSGDPKGDGSGGSEKTVVGEFSANGIRNDLSHVMGVISMARRGDPYFDSATSQFFICNADASRSLDRKYAGFGYVVAGLEVVLMVSDAEVTYNAYGTERSVPVEKIIIEKVSFVEKK